jgi:hypothetical protein
LRCLLTDEVFDELNKRFSGTAKWKCLDNAFVNLSHWTLVKALHDEAPYSRLGLFCLWNRHASSFCKAYFPNIDLVIPMAYQPDKGSEFDENAMSYIAIAVKNKASGTERLQDEFMSRKNVEGKTGDNEPSSTKYKDNHYLGLNRLEFISGKDKCWAQHTKKKPFVAIVLSMGETDTEKNLVVIEEPKAQPLSL